MVGGPSGASVAPAVKDISKDRDEGNNSSRARTGGSIRTWSSLADDEAFEVMITVSGGFGPFRGILGSFSHALRN